MADLQATIEWPGLEAVESFSGTLSHGSSPSVFRISCFPQKKPPKKSGKLTLRYGGFKMTLDDCIIDSASYSFNQSGDIIGLNILDRRWRWRGGYVSRIANTKPETAIDSAKDLFDELSEKTGEKWDTSDVAKDIFPSISWDYVSIAQALSDLCQQTNYRVVLQTSDKIKICKVNQGKQLPANLPCEGYGAGLDTQELPDSLLVVGAPLQVECDVYLKAVGMSEDKTLDDPWLPIEDLPYKPSTGWNVAWGTVDTGLMDRPQAELIRRYVFRAYRSRFFYTPNSNVIRARIADDIPDEKKPVVVQNQYSRQLMPVLYPETAVVWGDFADRNSLNGSDRNTGAAFEKVRKPTIPDSEKVNIDFQIISVNDYDFIVLFSEPVFRYKDDGTAEPANLNIRCTLQANHYDGGPIRYEKGAILGKTANGERLPMVIRAEDLVQTIDIEGKSFPADLEARANKYLNDKRKQLTDAKPEEATYTGWHKIELDGAIQSLAWTMGANGASMTVSRNQDYGSDTTISYPERESWQQAKLNSVKIQQVIAEKERQKRALIT